MALPELKDSVAAKHKLHDRFQKALQMAKRDKPAAPLVSALVAKGKERVAQGGAAKKASVAAAAAAKTRAEQPEPASSRGSGKGKGRSESRGRGRGRGRARGRGRGRAKKAAEDCGSSDESSEGECHAITT